MAKEKEKEKEVPDEFKKAIVKEFNKIEGVGDTTAEKLYLGGYFDLIRVAASSPSMLSDNTSIPIDSASKIVANAMKVIDTGGFETATERLAKEKASPKLTSGAESLDILLGGGFRSGIITEMAAPNGIGKTQIGFTIAVMATRPHSEGGLDSHVVYMDTENTFSSERIEGIIKARGYDVEETMDKIHIITTTSTAHQIVAMNGVRRLSAELGGIKLIVVDSVIAKFRSEYTGRSTLADRQQLLGKHLADLASFAIDNNAVIYVTNQVMSRPDAFFGDPNVATGGNIMGHDNAVRMYMRKGQKGKRVVKLAKAPNLPEGECVIQLSEKGIEDP